MFKIIFPNLPLHWEIYDMSSIHRTKICHYLCFLKNKLPVGHPATKLNPSHHSSDFTAEPYRAYR